MDGTWSIANWIFYLQERRVSFMITVRYFLGLDLPPTQGGVKHKHHKRLSVIAETYYTEATSFNSSKSLKGLCNTSCQPLQLKPVFASIEFSFVI